MQAILALREVMPPMGESVTLAPEEVQAVWDAAQADADEIKRLRLQVREYPEACEKGEGMKIKPARAWGIKAPKGPALWALAGTRDLMEAAAQEQDRIVRVVIITESEYRKLRKGKGC